MAFIDRGNQVDLVIFFEDYEFKVRVGQQVYGGKTVIAVKKGRELSQADVLVDSTG